MNDPDLYDALSLASLAVLHVRDGDGDKAGEAWMEASVAALTAFPEGSAKAHALNVVLGAVGDLAREVAV